MSSDPPAASAITPEQLIAKISAAFDHMDRGGGDAYAMPECPWCHCQWEPPSEPHHGDCELVAAREAVEQLRAEIAFSRAVKEPDGSGMIAAERVRQVSAEGWTATHDAEHSSGELVTAAMCYGIHASHQTRGGPTFDQEDVIRSRWPWEPAWWKPSPDPIRNLVKAGALIAAEIDRLKAGGA